MSDPNWASPSDQPAPAPAPSGPPVPLPPGQQPGYGPVTDAPPPGAGPNDATPMYYAMPDPHQNWGLNPNSGVRYEVLVPRPPRPGTVGVALVLTYVGVAISLVYLVLNTLEQWRDRDQVAADAVTGSKANGNIDATSIARDSVGLVLVVVVVLWLLAAAGLVICAILANRGRNGARITLAVLMGVLGLYQLCGALSAVAVTAVAPSGDSSTDSPFAALSASASNIHWWSYVCPSLLAVTAIIVFVLLIIPPTNRFFSPGPGRRFAPRA